eukprot:2743999-Rhodomonas_salina.1
MMLSFDAAQYQRLTIKGKMTQRILVVHSVFALNALYQFRQYGYHSPRPALFSGIHLRSFSECA